MIFQDLTPFHAHALVCIFSLVLLLMASPAVAAVTVRGDLGGGYREDNLDWSLAGDLSGKNPNVLSELEWDVESVELTGDLWLLLPRATGSAPFVRVWGGYGFITNGEARDSDYRGDNRTDEYSRTECSADDGYLYDIAGALGWEFIWPLGDDGVFSAAPFAGYAYSAQALTLADGMQVVSPSSATPIPLPGLDSDYTTSWQGPLAGMRLGYVHQDRLSLWLEGSYHQVDYEGEAEWNLRTDFAQDPSFRQTAEGDGWVVSGGVNHALGDHHAIAATLAYRKWVADEDGIDTLYLANGPAIRTRFNEAEWEAWSVSLRYAYQF